MTKPDDNGMFAVSPVKPIAPYVGGKSLLAKTIIPYIESIPHKAYCEPFIGIGGISELLISNVALEKY